MCHYGSSGDQNTNAEKIQIGLPGRKSWAIRHFLRAGGGFFFSTPRRVRYGVGDETRVVGTRIRTKPGKGALVEEVVIAGSPSHVR
jgi:hypothetical protein